MPKTRAPYFHEFRRQMVDLVRAGRDPDDLAREFEPTVQSIRSWVSSADKKEGRREEALPGLSAVGQDVALDAQLLVLPPQPGQFVAFTNQRGSGSACGARNGQAYSLIRR